MRKVIAGLVLACALVASAWASGASEPAEDGGPVSITWLAGVWANQVDPQGYFTDAVKEALDIDLTVNIMPAAQLGEKAQVLIAGGDYPEILMLHRGPDTLYKQWSQQGLFVQLDPYWNDYPGLAAAFPEEAALRPCRVNGDLYMVPVVLPSNRFGMAYRQDWLDALGLDIPETLDEFHQVMRAFTFDDPDGDGVDNTYGFGTDKGGGHGATIIMNAFGIPGSPTAWHVAADGSAAPNFTHENFPDALAFMQQCYEEGIMDPDSVTKIFAEVGRSYESGRIGVEQLQLWLAPVIEGLIRQVDPDGTIVFGPPITNPDGGKTWNHFTAAWRGNVITQKADTEAKIDAALRLFDWMVSDGEEMTFFGPEGVYWTERNSAGVPILEGEGLQAFGRAGDGYSEYQLLLRRLAPEPLVGSEVWTNAEATARAVEAFEMYADYGLLDPTVGITTPTMSEIGATLSDMILTGVFEVMIAGRPVSYFDEVLAEWRSSGGDRLIQEINDAR